MQACRDIVRKSQSSRRRASSSRSPLRKALAILIKPPSSGNSAAAQVGSVASLGNKACVKLAKAGDPARAGTREPAGSRLEVRVRASARLRVPPPRAPRHRDEKATMDPPGELSRPFPPAFSRGTSYPLPLELPPSVPPSRPLTHSPTLVRAAFLLDC
jgi:hypothetical protein